MGEGGALRRPFTVIVNIGVALIGQDNFAGAGGIGRDPGADLCVTDNGTVRLHLVEVEDITVQKRAEVDGLLHRVGKLLQLRAGHPAQVGLPRITLESRIRRGPTR